MIISQGKSDIDSIIILYYNIKLINRQYITLLE
jgi:hypothetical protein